MKIAISSGHSTKCRGAAGPEPWGLDEVDEAIKIMPEIAKNLEALGHQVETFTDTTSTDQNTNLNRIVNWHNDEAFDGDGHDLDCSIHLNAYIVKKEPMGCEVCYLTQEDLATRLSAAISNASGLINRGPKKRTDLFVLNNTIAPAVLLELCFVDSQTDCFLYRKYWSEIARAIAMVGNQGRPQRYEWAGKCSWFGGKTDTGMTPTEPLAFIYEVEQQPHVFYPNAEEALGRELNSEGSHFLAMRWDYDETPRELLLQKQALVRSPKTGKHVLCWPADWGPGEQTGRVCDLSKKAMHDLQIETDSEVTVSFPYDPAKET
jgi:N-acetylmuramoyl-L-alanine amidase